MAASGDETTPALSRRRFLQRLGLTGAALSVPGWLAACGDDGGGTEAGSSTTAAGDAPSSSAGNEAAAAPSGEELKVGLLVPLSGVYAALGA